MALVFVDSFDHYNTSMITRKWNSHSGCSISVGGGRNGTNAMYMAGDSSLRKGVAPLSEYWVGFAAKLSYTGSQGYEVGFMDTSSYQNSFQFDMNGHIYAYRKNDTQLGESSGTLQANRWYYIELRSVVSDTVGVMEIWVDGLQYLNVTGADTQFTLVSTIDEIYFNGFTLTGNMYMDDLYILNNSGGTYTTRLGDVHIQALLPDGAGAVSQFYKSPDTGESNYQDVDDNPPDDDTSFVYSQYVGYVDTYTYPSVWISSGNIYGVAVNLCDRKDDPGPRTTKAVARVSGINYGGNEMSSNEDYRFNQDIFEENPHTSGSWTISDVNAAEFGQKIET